MCSEDREEQGGQVGNILSDSSGGRADLVFHRFLGNSEVLGDFGVGESINTAQHEDVPATFRQPIQRFLQLPQSFPVLGVGIGDIQFEFDALDHLLLQGGQFMVAQVFVAVKSKCGKEIGLDVFDFNTRTSFPVVQPKVLQEVLGHIGIVQYRGGIAFHLLPEVVKEFLECPAVGLTYTIVEGCELSCIHWNMVLTGTKLDIKSGPPF